MRLNYTYSALILSATIWLTGCFPMLLEPLKNPPPRESNAVDNYEKYSFITAGKKMLILDEQFINNTRGWKQVNNPTDGTITSSGGAMMMRTLNTRQQNTISLTELKGTDNFEIEALVKIERSNYEGSSLVWGGSTSTAKQWFFFEINRDRGLLRIGSSNVASNYSAINYSTSGYNTLTVRKINNTLYYFINATFIDKEPFSSFYGPVIGFEAASNTTLWVDYLKVNRLNQ